VFEEINADDKINIMEPKREIRQLYL